VYKRQLLIFPMVEGGVLYKTKSTEKYIKQKFLLSK
jgi:hypothetical protein